MMLNHFPMVGMAVKQIRQAYEQLYGCQLSQAELVAVRSMQCMNDLFVIDEVGGDRDMYR
jgi:hypothetical protein